MNRLFQLFMAFFRTGMFGFGGGMATLPLIEEEVVERYHWLTIQEFTDSVAMSNSLPGPIATKMAALIGYKTMGPVGAVVGILGIVLPSTVMVIALITIYTKFKDQAWLKGMMRGVRPVIIALIFQVLIMLGRTSFNGVISVVIALSAFVMVYIFNFHPAVTIVLGMLFGIVFLR
jgi:chromate transporter